MKGIIRILAIILLVVSGFILFSPQTKAQSTDSWTSTASMNSPRADHTATILEDGRVLVAGGFDAQGFLSSAEIYDAHLGSWNLTASMASPRAYHAAVRLPDGRVLVAGGANNIAGKTSSSEIYNPSTALWTLTGSMNVARTSFALVKLDDGRVLAVGGFDTQGRFLTSCEVYDPTADSWTLTGSLHTARAALNIQSQVVKLTDGRVLIEGGLNPSNLVSDLTSAEIYDPQTEIWSFTGSLNIPRADQSAALLRSGKVIVAGGDSPPRSPSTSEIFDPSTGGWTMATLMTEFRSADTATALLDGRVLVVGPAGSSTEIYDEKTGTWASSGSRSTATEEHTATLLQDGRVLVAGGGFNGALYSQADLFTPETRMGVQVTTFFTDPSLNPLPSDSEGNPAVKVTFARGIARSTSPGQVLAWFNVTNTFGSSLQSLKMNETLPVDWEVSPPWVPGVGSIHVYYANNSSLATNPEITQPSTITVSTGNPETVTLAIPNFNSTAIGHSLLPGQSILLSVKLAYGLVMTSQSFASYPRNYEDSASASAWSLPFYTGTESSGAGSAFFVAYARVVGDPGGESPLITVSKYAIT